MIKLANRIYNTYGEELFNKDNKDNKDNEDNEDNKVIVELVKNRMNPNGEVTVDIHGASITFSYKGTINGIEVSDNYCPISLSVDSWSSSRPPFEDIKQFIKYRALFNLQNLMLKEKNTSTSGETKFPAINEDIESSIQVIFKNKKEIEELWISKSPNFDSGDYY